MLEHDNDDLYLIEAGINLYDLLTEEQLKRLEANIQLLELLKTEGGDEDHE